MTLRQKFAMAFALIAAVVVVIIGSVTYTTTERALHNEVNVSLVAAVSTLAAGGSLSSISLAGTGPGGDGHHGGDTIVETAQRIAADGTITHLSGAAAELPVSERALAIAKSSRAGERVVDQVANAGTNYQVLTQSLGDGKGAVQVGRDLDVVNHLLRDLGVVTLFVGLGVLLVAAAGGALMARRMTGRLTRLTAMAETVSKDGDLGVRFAMPGRDEVGRLSSSLQVMVSELAASREAQQRLVQNAGHELRTPLTSLRTNVSVLRRFGELSPGPSRTGWSQQRLLDDVAGETRELTDLVNELVELAMDRREGETAVPVDLAELSRRVAARFGHRRRRSVVVLGPPSVMVLGRPKALERAVSNLIDNALKFHTGDGAVDVAVSAGGVRVSDRGPGIDPADAGRLFDRFYRADAARSLPGSGLGLAIVAEVAAAHGGSGSAEPRAGGGATIGFSLGAESSLPDPGLETISADSGNGTFLPDSREAPTTVEG